MESSQCLCVGVSASIKSLLLFTFSHVRLNKGVCVRHERCRQRGEVVLAVGAGAELADVCVELAVPLLPLSEGLGAQARVLQEGTDYCQLRLFGLEEERETRKLPH